MNFKRGQANHIVGSALLGLLTANREGLSAESVDPKQRGQSGCVDSRAIPESYRYATCDRHLRRRVDSHCLGQIAKPRERKGGNQSTRNGWLFVAAGGAGRGMQHGQKARLAVGFNFYFFIFHFCAIFSPLLSQCWFFFSCSTAIRGTYSSFIKRIWYSLCADRSYRTR